MSSISDRLIKVIDEKGWLALSSIYFDNAVALTMNTSGGRVAYSASEGLVFWLSNQDILDSANTENGLIHMDPSFMGHQTHLVVQDIECIKPIYEMPNLPVARVMWKGMPDLKTGIHAWIMAGGAHHTVLSYAVTAEQMEDWAEIMGIEFVHITKDTTISALKQQLLVSDLAWKLK